MTAEQQKARINAIQANIDELDREILRLKARKNEQIDKRIKEQDKLSAMLSEDAARRVC